MVAHCGHRRHAGGHGEFADRAHKRRWRRADLATGAVRARARLRVAPFPCANLLPARRVWQTLSEVDQSSTHAGPRSPEHPSFAVRRNRVGTSICATPRRSAVGWRNSAQNWVNPSSRRCGGRPPLRAEGSHNLKTNRHLEFQPAIAPNRLVPDPGSASHKGLCPCCLMTHLKIHRPIPSRLRKLTHLRRRPLQPKSPVLTIHPRLFRKS